MVYLVSLITFLTGSAVVMFYYRYRVRKWRDRLLRKIENNVTKSGTGKPAETVSDEFSKADAFYPVVNKLESVLRNQATSISEILPVENPDANITGLRKVIDNLYIVNELGQRVTSSLNLQQTFHHLYTTINSMMDAAVLELSVYETQEYEYKYFSNLESHVKSYLNNMAEWSRKNNREVYLSDAERDFARYVFEPLVLPDGQRAKSIMVFPVSRGVNVSGTLAVISFKPNSFEPYHQEIIRSLLGYISVAIENALTHDELNRTKIRAEQSEKFKEQFLANMSHEIRTPINAVTGMTRLLLEKSPREDQLRYLESINNASDSLLVIINDILDLSKIEAGMVELEQIDFSVSEVLKNVHDIMQFKAEEKGLTLTFVDDNNLPPVLTGDPTRLSQVLINLIGNAIKFTEKGSVSVKASIASKFSGEDGGSMATLAFVVSDTGIGMTQVQQARLFQDYAQASSDTTRKYGGTGLGLSISRQLVQLQGGAISVESSPGAGSRFTCSIPYRISSSKVVEVKQQIVSDEMLNALNGIRVLLADDNEYNRIVARETLQLKLQEVWIDEAVDGMTALDMIKKNKYDVVLMDLVMPGLNGFEATRHIRNNFQSPAKDFPILALTASVIKSEIDKCMEAGMNGFVPKPFKPHELLGAIYDAMQGKKTLIDIPEQTTQPIAENPDTLLIDLDYLDEFAEGDPVRLHRLIDLFLEKVPSGLTALKTALGEGDFDKIRITAHSMKPQLRFTGVARGLELAETIEQNCSNRDNLEAIPGLIESLERVCEKAMDELRSRNTRE